MSSTESATITGCSRYTGGNAFKRETRGHGTLLSAQIAQGMSFVHPDEQDEGDSGTYTNLESSWEFTPVCPSTTRRSKLSGTTHTSAAQKIATKFPDRSTGTTEAQQIVHDYLQKHDGRTEVKQSTVVHTTKELPMLSDRTVRTSTYTLVNIDDGQSTIDLEKRPEPAIRLFHHDRGGLAQAQHQGMEMIQAGRCTPGESIRCQRPGCTNVLRDLEALKFHLHIHNIGDSSNIMSTIPAYLQKTEGPSRTSVVSPPPKKPTKNVHYRSKSSAEIGITSRQPRSTYSTGQGDAKDPYSLSDSATSNTLHVQTKVPSQSRGRRSNRRTFQNGLGEAGYNDSIAMVLSRPTSPVRISQELVGPKRHPPLEFLNQTSSFPFPAGSGQGGKEFSSTKALKRAFSPARAFSPIRDGLRRVLSLGCLNDWECN